MFFLKNDNNNMLYMGYMAIKELPKLTSGHFSFSRENPFF